MSNPIVTENALSGTTAWETGNGATTQIQAYCNKTSVNPGDTLTFYASVDTGGTGYKIDFYRLGYYNALGGNLKLEVTGFTGVAQGYWNNSTVTLVNDTNKIYDATTHLLEAGWSSSYVLTVPSNWITGVYMARFVDANGYCNNVSFIVKGNTSADYVYVRPTTTDQAYNIWGGYDLYSAPQGTKISYNRPIFTAAGMAGIYQYELSFIHWAEKQGYNLSYISDVDIEANPAILNGYKAVISPGHDEYWSLTKRNAFEAARDAGNGLAFLGADACGWQIRFEPDAAGNPNRTIVGYKVTTAAHNLANDPQYGVNNAIVTSNWRDAVINRPENAMIGIMFSSNSSNVYFPWTVDANPDLTYLVGTGLVPGQSYGCDLVGNEWDKIFNNGFSPANIQVIGTTAVTGVSGADISQTTVYVASSHALVFASGSLAWTWALDSFRDFNLCNPKTVAGMQTLMANIMTALIAPKTFNMISV